MVIRNNNNMFKNEKKLEKNKAASICSTCTLLILLHYYYDSVEIFITFLLFYFLWNSLVRFGFSLAIMFNNEFILFHLLACMTLSLL